MERPKFLLNLFNMLLCISLLMVFTLSCTQIKGIAGLNEQTKEQNEFNYYIPHGYKNTEPDQNAWSESSFVILMPNSDQIFVGKLDSIPVEVTKLGEMLKSFAGGKSEAERVVYIAATYYVSKDAFTRVIEELRNSEIETVRLLASSATRRKDIYGNQNDYDESMGDFPPPDSIFEIALKSPNIEGKPDPLTLVVKPLQERMVALNNEPYKDENELGTKLTEIFKNREMNGAFRVNTNEIEKSVWFMIGGEDQPSNNNNLSYRDVIRIIDTLKGAGASPVIFTDQPLEPFEVSFHRQKSESDTTQERSSVPKTISGGVLNGKATSLPKPEYPAAAKAVRASGMVNVQIKVDATGKVIEAKAVSGHPLLRSAAEQAARTAIFAPTLLSGTPVIVTGVLTYNFKPE